MLWPATECHWSDTEEGYSCCTRRLECKSGQGCLWKLARHLWTLLQWWHKWERIRLLEFAIFNDLVLANTFGHHKASRRWTWHSPNGQHHNQIDYILVRKNFRSGMNIARTRSFPGTDIGSDHDLLMMTFRLRLKKISKPKHTKLKFDLEKLKDPNVLESFQAMIGGRFAPLSIMSNKDTDIDSMITTFNTAVTVVPQQPSQFRERWGGGRKALQALDRVQTWNCYIFSQFISNPKTHNSHTHMHAHTLMQVYVQCTPFQQTNWKVIITLY